MSEEVTLDEFADSSDTEGSQERVRSRFWDEIPEGWRLVNGSEVYDVNPNPKPKEEPNTYIEMDALDTELPWPKYLGTRDASEYSGKTFTEGDTLFARITPCTENGKAALVPEMETEVGIGSTEYAVLSPKTDSINPWLLYYLGKSYPVHNYAVSRMRGSTGRQRVPFSVFRRELDIALPPLPEQRKIATVLYTIDRAIEKTSELIEQLGRVKQGVRQNILTSGITEDGKVRASPESEPEQYTDARQWTVPNSWGLKELSDVSSIQVGYAFKSDWYHEEGNVRVLRGANVGYGEPDWSETYFLEPERVSEYEDYLLNEGDLIIGMDRPYTNSGFKISRLSETDVPSLLVQRVGRFVPEGCDPDYLHVVLSDWRYQKQVLRRAQGMDIPHISQTDILSPKVPLPPLDEQKRIADRYSSILERIDCEENLLREYKTLKQGLMQDLLSGTVRTTDTNIEVPEEIAQYG
jgi:type I restriction enzyme S subunit